MASAPDLELRPVRPSDRSAILEMVSDVWDGHDYIPAVFDGWVSDPASRFEAAELDGQIVGLQRMRPLGPTVRWYEGLRVASSHRRLGVARTMLNAAIEEARRTGATQIRLATGNPDAVKLFEAAGFAPLVSARRWEAARMEGDEPARIPSPEEAAGLAAWVAADPGTASYNGVVCDFAGAWDVDADGLARAAAEGAVRVGPGGRSLAVVQPRWQHLQVTFLSGSGGSLDDLLLRLRFEADNLDLDGAIVWAPQAHPAADQLRASGYDFDRDPALFSIYALTL